MAAAIAETGIATSLTQARIDFLVFTARLPTILGIAKRHTSDTSPLAANTMTVGIERYLRAITAAEQVTVA